MAIISEDQYRRPSEQGNGWLAAGCAAAVFLAITLVTLGIVFNLIAFPLKIAQGIGEAVRHTISWVTGGEGAAGSGGDTTLGTQVPDPLRQLFIEAAQRTGTPAALIAAISFQECARLWDRATSDPTTVQTWINANSRPDNSGCVKNNGSNVFGPMQFQVGIRYLRAHGYPDIRDGYYYKGRYVPAPQVGSWEGYIDRTAAATGRSPSVVEPIIIRDAVYAGALKLYNDAGKPSTWTEEHIRRAAGRYFGRCIGAVGDKTVYYCDDIVRRYNQYQGQLGG